MLRAIQEIKPTWVIAENVFGIVNIDGGLVFEQVCLDLEAEGYEVQPFIIPAASVGAPHRRDRVWFVAYANGYPSNKCNSNDEINASEGRINALCNAEQGNGNGNATDTYCTSAQCRDYETTKGWEDTRRRIEPFGFDMEWKKFPTQSPICGGDDGLPTQLDGITFSKWRNESIKGYGNAIVPQIAYQLFQIIEHESKNQNT